MSSQISVQSIFPCPRERKELIEQGNLFYGESSEVYFKPWIEGTTLAASDALLKKIKLFFRNFSFSACKINFFKNKFTPSDERVKSNLQELGNFSYRIFEACSLVIDDEASNTLVINTCFAHELKRNHKTETSKAGIEVKEVYRSLISLSKNNKKQELFEASLNQESTLKLHKILNKFETDDIDKFCLLDEVSKFFGVSLQIQHATELSEASLPAFKRATKKECVDPRQWFAELRK